MPRLFTVHTDMKRSFYSKSFKTFDEAWTFLKDASESDSYIFKPLGRQNSKEPNEWTVMHTDAKACFMDEAAHRPECGPPYGVPLFNVAWCHDDFGGASIKYYKYIAMHEWDEVLMAGILKAASDAVEALGPLAEPAGASAAGASDAKHASKKARVDSGDGTYGGAGSDGQTLKQSCIYDVSEDEGAGVAMMQANESLDYENLKKSIELCREQTIMLYEQAKAANNMALASKLMGTIEASEAYMRSCETTIEVKKGLDAFFAESKK